MNIPGHLILLFLLCLIILSCGCTHKETGNIQNEIVITDDTGYNTTIKTDIHRVVSLSPSETEIFHALSPESRGISLVGRTDYDNFPSEVKNVTSVGGPTTLSIEAIASVNPDLILTTTVADENIINQLRDLEYPVLVFNTESYNGIYNNIDKVGKALKLGTQADSLISSLKKSVGEITGSNRVGSLNKVMFVISVQPLYVAGNNTFQSEFITTSGGKNIFGDMSGYFVPSDEEIDNLAPDAIIVPSTSTEKELLKEQLLQTKSFSSVPAIINKKICVIDEDIILRPGPRFIEGLKEVDSCINE